MCVWYVLGVCISVSLLCCVCRRVDVLLERFCSCFSELNLAVASHISDRLVDALLETLDKSLKTLVGGSVITEHLTVARCLCNP